jgi:hypothetical protein
MPDDQILSEAKRILRQLYEVIQSLDHKSYNAPIAILGQATLGEHSRHIIEMFQLLIFRSDDTIQYHHRERNLKIQTDPVFAAQLIIQLMSGVIQEDKPLFIQTELSPLAFPTSYYREVVYNIEHCIHHQAIIKIGLEALAIPVNHADLGIAPSTLSYRAQCAP